MSLETAFLVFDDPQAISVHDRDIEGEERWQTIGRAAGITIIAVAHTLTVTDREEIIRLVPARKATRSERRFYDQAD